MKKKRYQADKQRTILTSLIVHTGVLSQVYQKVGREKNPFEDRWSNQIAKWCFDHFEKYQKAPSRSIQDIFSSYAENNPDGDSVELIESFLACLSDEFERSDELNEKYLVDQASEFFEKIRLTRYSKLILDSVDKGDIETARKDQASYQPLSFASSDWSSPFDAESIRSTFHYYEEDRSLIKFPGDLGEFLNDAFERDGFIAFHGPEKRGKSYWLTDVVYQALRQKQRVLWYVLGDMSSDQVRRRLYCRATRRPFKTQMIRIPTKVKPLKKGEFDYDSKEEERKALSAIEVRNAADELKKKMSTKELKLKLKAVGGGMLSAGDVEIDIQNFAKADEPIDVVVVDYADELAAEPHTRTMDKRHQINETWRILRRIALNNHCLMVTATQSAATAYDKDVIRKTDFSESKTKNAHVTGALGINQTPEEKKLGIFRLNWLFLREGKWADNQTVMVAGNLAIACPAIISSF